MATQLAVGALGLAPHVWRPRAVPSPRHSLPRVQRTVLFFFMCPQPPSWLLTVETRPSVSLVVGVPGTWRSLGKSGAEFGGVETQFASWLSRSHLAA